MSPKTDDDEPDDGLPPPRIEENAGAEVDDPPEVIFGHHLERSHFEGSFSDDSADDELGPPTTKNEVRGWYGFDWASSPFSNSFLGGLAAPILSGFATLNADDNGQVHALFGIPLNPLSYYSAIVSVSVIFEIVSFILFGALADFGGMRKRMLVVSTVCGSFFGALFLVVPPEGYWADGWLFVLANMFYGLSMVFYNSFLQLLVKNDPQVRFEKSPETRFEVAQKLDNLRSGIGFAIGYVAALVVLLTNLAFLFFFPNCNERCPHCLDRCYGFEVESRASSRECLLVFNDTTPESVLSGNFSRTTQGNYSAGEFDACRSEYGDMSGGDGALTFTQALVNTTATDVLSALLGEHHGRCGDSTLCEDKQNLGTVDFAMLHECVGELDTGCDPDWWTVRTQIFLSCAWWIGFGFLSFYYIQVRRSAPKPPDQTYVTAGLQKLGKTMRQAKRLPNTFRFLIAFWLFSDGMYTFAIAAALFAIDVLGATALELILLYLCVLLNSALGSYLLSKFHHRFRWTTLRGMIWTTLVVVCLVTSYARIPGLLTTYPELYVLGSIYGVQMGSVQSFTRVMLGRMTPPGHEAEFFSLYEVTNKGTSWLGPIAVAVVIEVTGDVRWGVMTILPFIVIGGVILFWVNEKAGIREALDFVEDDEVALEPTSDTASDDTNSDTGSNGRNSKTSGSAEDGVVLRNVSETSSSVLERRSIMSQRTDGSASTAGTLPPLRTVVRSASAHHMEADPSDVINATSHPELFTP
jgi:MFS-type transporter involved in bile tolerance (Atg22 family)